MRKLLIAGALLLAIAIVVQVFLQREPHLKRANGTIHVLLLGIGGDGHEGPELTDTIIFAKLDPEKNKVVLVSIPRDLWVPQFKTKINSIYALGNNEEKNDGLKRIKQVVSTIINQKINYVAVVDFGGFVEAIDIVGGITVSVDRGFDDYEYPVEENREDLCGKTLEEAAVLVATESPTLVFPCRYRHAHFDKGIQHMDGKRALVFVRSRYAKGSEGTDFARSVRQQKVIKAFREKFFTPQVILNPLIIAKLYSVFRNSVITDIVPSEFYDFLKLAEKIKSAEVRSWVIEAEDEEEKKPGLLINPDPSAYAERWVLIPRRGDGDFLEIQQHVACLVSFGDCRIN